MDKEANIFDVVRDLNNQKKLKILPTLAKIHTDAMLNTIKIQHEQIDQPLNKNAIVSIYKMLYSSYVAGYESALND